MDATQVISDSILESDEEENEEESENERQPVAKLCILKNEHIPETELPLFLGDNVLGRDTGTCTLPLPAASVSKRHATICISVYRRRGCHNEVDTEALVWDLGSMNGTRKGRLKLTPNVRYALSEGDSLVVADIPCKFVICNVDSSQVETRTPVSIHSGLKGRLPDAYGEKSVDISSGSKKCVNSGSKPRASLQRTPVGASCLSFEQTPTQPQGTLVPESDSDSDNERGRRGGDRRHKALVSNSESHQSSPTCSTFLSPSNKIVPESEDESPITPSSSTKNRPYRDVSFSKDEADVDSGRQQLKAPTTVNDSEEEQGREDERAAQGRTKSKESGHVPAKEESNVSLDEMPVSKPAVFTDVIPAFSMDSDTDMEGEEEVVASAGPVTLNKKQQVDQKPNTLQFHMDSDTDVDEDDEVSGEAASTLPSSNEKTKPPHVISVIQPGGITVDSDTDVEDAAAVSDATKIKPTSFQKTADSADFHLDSDTDFDEEEENGGGETKNRNSKTDETPNKLDVKLIVPEYATAAGHNLHLDSDTDGKAIPAVGESLVAAAVSESCTIANAGASLDILSDSDTDAEDDSPVALPVGATTLSVPSGATSEALQTNSDADTDVDESSVPPAGEGAKPSDLRMDSDTDVEDTDADVGETGEDQIPRLHRENTPGSLVPLLLNCSTPTPVSEGEVEEMETQAFTSPSSGAFRSRGAPALRPVVLSSCSDSQEDEDFVVAETQSFVLQGRDRLMSMEPTQAFVLESSGNRKDEQSSRDESFQLGLSDSSHLQCQDQAVATESTRAFISVESGVNLEDTQTYAATSAAQKTSAENDSNLDHMQAYGEIEEPDSCLVASEKGSQVDLALEATQAYISEPCSDPDDDISEDERQNSATTDTESSDFTTSSTLAMAETQPVSSFVGEETLATDGAVSSVQQSKPRTLNETEEKATHSQERPLSEALSISETQPVPKSDDEKSSDEDSFLGPRKRIVKPLLIEEEQTQPLTTLPLAETQPMHVDESQPMAICEEDKSDDADSRPGPRKRKAKQLHLEAEETQQRTNSELSVAETQPMSSYDDDDDDDDTDLLPGTRKRKAKPLQFEDETQPLTNSEASVVATQPVVTGGNEGSDDEDSIPLIRKKKAKQLHLEEEETQPLTNSEAPSVETQPLGACEVGQNSWPVVTDKHEESDDEDSIPGPRKRKAKKLQLEDEQTQTLTNSEVSTAETQPLKTKTGTQAQKDKDSQSEIGISAASVRNVRETRITLREKEEQIECSVPTQRQTRGENKMLPSTRGGRRGKVRPDEDNNSEEDTEQAKRPRRKTITRQQKEDDEKDKRPKIEKNKSALNKNLMKEHDEGNFGEEKDISEQREKENTEMESTEFKEREREQEEMERQHRSKEETFENEQRMNEEQERSRAKRILLELERAERGRKENEEKERLEIEKEEKERLEREEKETVDRERKDEEETESLKTAERELEERCERERKTQEDQARLEREAKEREEREKEKQSKDQQENQEKDEAKAPLRGRRATRRTITSQGPTEQEQGTTISTGEDFPAMRTRSRSNSSNSVSSERSASSVIMQESKGRGRGRGRKRTSQPPQTTAVRSSHQKITVAAGPSGDLGQDSNDIRPLVVLSRSNSSNSLNSEISSCSVSTQNKGRGTRQRGGGRKTKPDPDPVFPPSSQSDQNAAPKSTARGRKGKKAEESSSEVLHEDDKDKADSQQASTSRGRRKASANSSEPAAAGEEDQSNQQEGGANDESLLPKRNVRDRGQKRLKSETVVEAAPTVNVGDEAKEKRRKSGLEVNVGAECSHGKISVEKAQKAEASEEQGHNETKEEESVKRKGRASNSQAKKNAKESHPQVKAKETEEMEVETIEKRARGRASVVPRKRTGGLQESGTSMNQEANVQTSEPQTPNARVSRKRQAPADSSPVAKTPRSSSASPVAGGRLPTSSQTYKVLFTGVVDEAGEKVLAHLGGSIAKGVADMNCLVTDKVRRTVKFLCAVAKGVPVVTTDWLEKSGKAGCFLSPNTFFVKDPEQEKKFSFCLQDSLRTANSQPLLQGYEIHVTKSVKPEPVHMKDIISSSGATFLAKMPSSHKPQTVVISCEEDWPLCGPAVSASLPIVTAEFILTGILQQKLDFQTHTLAPPVTVPHPAGGRGRGRRKM